MKYDPKKHHRRSIRLQGYDYSKAGLYFITICIEDREHLFGEIKNGKMILNEYGEIAHKEWANTPNIRANIALGEYIIMPNHIHGIIQINFSMKKDESPDKTKKEHETPTASNFKSPSQTIGAIIRGFKIATIRRIKDLILEKEEEIEKEKEKEKESTGELQFAPTAPTHKIRQLDYKIWQRNYYEIIIRDEQAYFNISEYIINNPKKWQEDKFYKL